MIGKMLTMAALGTLAAATPAAAQWNGGVVDTGSLRAEIDNGVARGDISAEAAASLRSQLRGLINLERQYQEDGLNGRERDDLRQRALGLRNEIGNAEGDSSGDPRYGGNGYGSNGTGSYRNYGNNGAYDGGRTNPTYNNAPYGNAPSNGGYGNGAYGNGAYGNGTYGNRAYGNDQNDSEDRYDGAGDRDANDNGAYRNDGYRNDGRYAREDDAYDREDGNGGYALRVGDRASGDLYGVPDAYRYRFRDGAGVYYRYGNGSVYQIDARTGIVLRIYPIGR